jgi:hypothetical protein
MRERCYVGGAGWDGVLKEVGVRDGDLDQAVVCLGDGREEPSQVRAGKRVLGVLKLAQGGDEHLAVLGLHVLCHRDDLGQGVLDRVAVVQLEEGFLHLEEGR